MHFSGDQRINRSNTWSRVGIEIDADRRLAGECDATLNNIRAHADRWVREAHYDQSQPRLFREGGNIPPIW